MMAMQVKPERMQVSVWLLTRSASLSLYIDISNLLLSLSLHGSAVAGVKWIHCIIRGTSE